MIDESRRLLELCNARLKAGKIGVALELRGAQDWIYLRGTFPPKPGSGKRHPYQQRIALKMRGTPQAIKEAEAIAKLVGSELNLGRFDWRKWSDAEEETLKTIGEYAAEFERRWWQGNDRGNPANVSTWNKAYRVAIRTLPVEKELTVDALIDWVIDCSDLKSKHGGYSRTRANYCKVASELAKLAGLDGSVFKELRSPASIKPINPRELPNDEEIERVISAIDEPGWRYLAALMAAYGLRNHECFGLELSEFPIIRVRSGTKTGERPVGPLYPRWAEQWQLERPVMPRRFVESGSNALLGAKLTKWFGKNMPFAPYNLRHCYARRCAQLGVETETAAYLMGHTPQVHSTVYRCWIGEKVRLDRYRKVIETLNVD